MANQRSYIILAGAFGPELEPFQPLDHQQVEIDNQEFTVILKESGIGSVKAAVSVTRWYQEAKKANISISEIVFVGSCGLYTDSKNVTDLQINDLPSAVFSSSYCCYELSTLTEPPQAKSIELLSALIQTSLSKEAKLSNRLLATVPNVVVNSPNAVSLLPIQSSVLAERTNQDKSTLFVENLEAFGMAYASLELNLNFSSFLSVTNLVSNEGSIDWQKNFIRGANLLYQLVSTQFKLKS
ncbi:MAG: hypothetical protein H3C43_01870 [Leptonema sp. (in: Bacteria)]|nr:hypothetical protein [Leptonema sp. (in: bacteria)]